MVAFYSLQHLRLSFDLYSLKDRDTKSSSCKSRFLKLEHLLSHDSCQSHGGLCTIGMPTEPSDLSATQWQIPR